jgi:hypothetical protein
MPAKRVAYLLEPQIVCTITSGFRVIYFGSSFLCVTSNSRIVFVRLSRAGRSPDVQVFTNQILCEKKKKEEEEVTGHGGLRGCEMLRIPHCLDSRLTGGDEVSLTHQPRFTPRKIFISVSDTHFCYTLSKPQDLERLDGLCI